MPSQQQPIRMINAIVLTTTLGMQKSSNVFWIVTDSIMLYNRKMGHVYVNYHTHLIKLTTDVFSFVKSYQESIKILLILTKVLVTALINILGMIV
jgi:hypothetical protein